MMDKIKIWTGLNIEDELQSRLHKSFDLVEQFRDKQFIAVEDAGTWMEEMLDTLFWAANEDEFLGCLARCKASVQLQLKGES